SRRSNRSIRGERRGGRTGCLDGSSCRCAGAGVGGTIGPLGCDIILFVSPSGCSTITVGPAGRVPAGNSFFTGGAMVDGNGKVRIGIIGFGGMGTAHANYLHKGEVP